MPAAAEDGTNTTPATLVVVPVLRRPWRVLPFLESVEAATPEPHRVMFVASSDDRPMIDEIIRVAESDPLVTLEVLAPNRVGDYARKVNHALAVSSEPFLFTAADDLAFHPDWLRFALTAMQAPAVGVVGTDDLSPTARNLAGEHSTHLLVRRTYAVELGTIDERGKIFHEGYAHEFVDDELVATAKARGAWYFERRSVVEHLHPSWGKAKPDALYRQQAVRMNRGRALFARRRGLWTSTSR